MAPFAAFLLLAAPLRAGEDPVVLYPPDLTLSTADRIRVYAFVPGKDPVTATVNGVNAVTLEGEDFRTGELSLFPGLNVLNVGGKRLRVYDVPGARLDRFEQAGPQGTLTFVALRLHQALDDGCAGCHVVEGGKLAAKAQKEACYGCHDSFEKAPEGKKAFLHAPVATGECTACHDPHFSALPKLARSDKGCAECHDPFPPGASVHYPVKEGECTACHSPHAGPAPKQLARAGNALCLGCHESPHVQHRSAQVRGTMTQVPPDFPRSGEELACTGCHAPHRSDERRLFTKPQGALCQTCHPV